jgi:predicted nucleic acid-binding protein
VIVVDSSVWIDFLNGRKAPRVARQQAILGNEEIAVGDLMLCEVLQGLASERAARQGRGAFAPLRNRFDGRRGGRNRGGPQLPVLAPARHHRSEDHRSWCIENRRPLLHNDSDFRPMAQHLGLMEAPMRA